MSNMQKVKPHWAFWLPMAVCTIAVLGCITVVRGPGNQAPIWLRQEAYATAVDVALAKADAERSDPVIERRDFTQERNVVGNVAPDSIFESCTLPLNELPAHTGLIGGECTASPGVGGIRRNAQCPEKTCVVVSVRDETWSDPKAREVILSTLGDHDAVCRYAAQFGPNRRADIAAAGCGDANYPPVKIGVEVKPRLDRPCKNIPDGNGSRPICGNPGARLIMLTS